LLIKKHHRSEMNGGAFLCRVKQKIEGFEK